MFEIINVRQNALSSLSRQLRCPAGANWLDINVRSPMCWQSCSARLCISSAIGTATKILVTIQPPALLYGGWELLSARLEHGEVGMSLVHLHLRLDVW